MWKQLLRRWVLPSTARAADKRHGVEWKPLLKDALGSDTLQTASETKHPHLRWQVLQRGTANNKKSPVEPPKKAGTARGLEREWGREGFNVNLAPEEMPWRPLCDTMLQQCYEKTYFGTLCGTAWYTWKLLCGPSGCKGKGSQSSEAGKPNAEHPHKANNDKSCQGSKEKGEEVQAMQEALQRSLPRAKSTENTPSSAQHGLCGLVAYSIDAACASVAPQSYAYVLHFHEQRSR